MYERPELSADDSAEELESENRVGDPFAVIESVRQEIMVTGSVDFEQDALNQIAKDLRDKKIDDVEAIKRARSVQLNRQDYH